eukprot:ANDGO_00128.mRNA.1 Cysteine synthase 1
MKVCDGLWDSVGRTPLVELKTLSELLGCRILGKAEWLNPGGSVKDRAAKYLIDAAEKSGKLVPHSGMTIVEASGGNTALALVLLSRARGYNCIFTIPETVSPEKINMMKRLGAQVVLCPIVPFSDDRHFYHQARKIAEETPGAYWTDQFMNIANSNSHFETTAPEIWDQTDGEISGFVCAAGTGGTISGISRFLKEKKGAACSVHLVDCGGSGLKSYVETGTFVVEGSTQAEGIGIGRLVENFATAVVDGAFFCTDAEAFRMISWLIAKEGLVLGPSAALNVVGAVKLARKLGPGNTIVTVLCDAGERYQKKVFDVEWLKSQNLFFDGSLDADLNWIL